MVGGALCRDVLRGFDGFAEKAPAVGFFKQTFEKRLPPGYFFFVDSVVFLGAPAL